MTRKQAITAAIEQAMIDAGIDTRTIDIYRIAQEALNAADNFKRECTCKSCSG